MMAPDDGGNILASPALSPTRGSLNEVGLQSTGVSSTAGDTWKGKPISPPQAAEKDILIAALPVSDPSSPPQPAESDQGRRLTTSSRLPPADVSGSEGNNPPAGLRIDQQSDDDNMQQSSESPRDERRDDEEDPSEEDEAANGPSAAASDSDASMARPATEGKAVGISRSHLTDGAEPPAAKRLKTSNLDHGSAPTKPERKGSEMKGGVGESQAASAKKVEVGQPKTPRSVEAVPRRKESVDPGDMADGESDEGEEDLEDGWEPQAGEIVWTRINKSKTQALGIIAKCPKDARCDPEEPSVYCEIDGDDRYLVAYLHNEGHVYPPRHYLIPFDIDKAVELKVYKNKVNKLSSWERNKRKAIKEAKEYLEGKHKFEHGHNFQKCSTCCDEGDDEFWAKIRLKRGTLRPEMKAELERQRRKAKKSNAVREQKAQEREARKNQKPVVKARRGRPSKSTVAKPSQTKTNNQSGRRVKSSEHDVSEDTETSPSDEEDDKDSRSGDENDEEETSETDDDDGEEEDESGESENSEDDFSESEAVSHRPRRTRRSSRAPPRKTSGVSHRITKKSTVKNVSSSSRRRTSCGSSRKACGPSSGSAGNSRKSGRASGDKKKQSADRNERGQSDEGSGSDDGEFTEGESRSDNESRPPAGRREAPKKENLSVKKEDLSVKKEDLSVKNEGVRNRASSNASSKRTNRQSNDAETVCMSSSQHVKSGSKVRESAAETNGSEDEERDDDESDVSSGKNSRSIRHSSTGSDSTKPSRPGGSHTSSSSESGKLSASGKGRDDEEETASEKGRDPSSLNQRAAISDKRKGVPPGKVARPTMSRKDHPASDATESDSSASERD